MRNFEVALFCVVIGCLVKLNEPWEASSWNRGAVQEEIRLDPERSILGNTDFDPEYDDVKSRDKKNEEPSQFSSRVRREESEIDYSECGVIEENPKFESESGYITDVWPWMVALLYVKDTSSKDEFICGGSIINKRFVMTSAICVTSSKAIPMKPNELSVVLGLANRGGEDQSQRFDVKAVYVHPGFRTGSYDNDIALLELEKPIMYSHYIRPICLPTDNSNLYKPQSPGLGLGFGSSTPWGPVSTLKQNALKEVNLVIQHPDACKEYLGVKYARYFTDRIFCAEEESPALCAGDGGGPVMQSEVREDGHRIWRQVGIVSFGMGCGPERSMGFYSYVYKFLPWIQDIAN